MINNKCLYIHKNNVTGKVFYVGIGNEKRPFIKSNRSERWKSYVKKYGYSVVILERNLSLDKVINREKFYIQYYGRKDLNMGELINLTDGGERTPEKLHHPETKMKAAETMRKFYANGGVSWNLGRKASNETKKKLSESLKKREITEKWRINNSNSLKGRKLSDETKRKISDAAKRQWANK